MTDDELEQLKNTIEKFEGEFAEVLAAAREQVEPWQEEPSNELVAEANNIGRRCRREIAPIIAQLDQLRARLEAIELPPGDDELRDKVNRDAARLDEAAAIIARCLDSTRG